MDEEDYYEGGTSEEGLPTPLSLMAEVAQNLFKPDEKTKEIIELINKDLRTGNIDEREKNIVMNTIGYIANVKHVARKIFSFSEEEIENMTFDKVLSAHAYALLNLSVSKDGFLLRNLSTVRQLIRREERRERRGGGIFGLFKKKREEFL